MNDDEFFKYLNAVDIVMKVIVNDSDQFERFMREVWCELKRTERLEGHYMDTYLKRDEKSNEQD